MLCCECIHTHPRVIFPFFSFFTHVSLLPFVSRCVCVCVTGRAEGGGHVLWKAFGDARGASFVLTALLKAKVQLKMLCLATLRRVLRLYASCRAKAGVTISGEYV